MPPGTEGNTELQEANALGESIDDTILETPTTPDTNDQPNEQPQETEEPQKEFDPKESTQETVKRALKEERDKALRGEGEKSEEEKDPLDLGKPGRPPKDEKFDPDLIPNQRLTLEEKELFTRLPRGLKKALNSTIKNLESGSSKTYNELRSKQTEYKEIDEVIAPHVTDWNQRGFTKSQAIAQLIATQSKLVNPETKLATAAWVLDNCGVTPEEIYAYKNGGVQQQPTASAAITQHPEYLRLQNQVNQLTSVEQQRQSYVQAQIAEQERAVASRAVLEVEALRNEVDHTGKFRYPKLHDDQFLYTAKPLVSALVSNTPGLSYGEAFKRAYHAIEGTLPVGAPYSGTNGNPGNQSQPALSVRGRSAPAASYGQLDELSPEEMKDSQSITRAVFNRMQNKR